MTDIWLPNMAHDPIMYHTNGPFKACYGVVLHVNQSNGRLESFFASGPPRNQYSVTPNFQLYKVGAPTQYLPLGYQPWTQENGNFNYGSMESEGYVNEPLNDNQLHWAAIIMKAYNTYFKVPFLLANAAGQKGLGTHAMGGAAWGGHPCPGDIRTAQRSAILVLANPPAPTPDPVTEEDVMYLVQVDTDKSGAGGKWYLKGESEYSRVVSSADYTRLTQLGIKPLSTGKPTDVFSYAQHVEWLQRTGQTVPTLAAVPTA